MTETTTAVHDPDNGQYAPCPCCKVTGLRGAARGWHHRKGPLPVLAKRYGTDPSWGTPTDARWIDHAYRIRQGDGTWCWVAEPYSLDPDAFADLAHLEQHGFRVYITAWQARHYPGHTLAVRITERTGR